MGNVFALSLTAALNPTLVAAVTVMLTLSKPSRLLLGYLGGALVTSVTLGLIRVFAIPGSSTSSTAKHQISPTIDLVLGSFILLIAFVVGTQRDRRRREWSERRKEKAKSKPPPKWRATLSKGTARDTFLVGALLSFPGASYIAGMDRLSKQHVSTGATILAVLAFNAVMLMLLELPLLGYAIRPTWTAGAVAKFNVALRVHGGRAALITATVIGIALLVKGLVSL